MAEQINITTVYGPAPALHWYLSDREQLWQVLKELGDNHNHRGTLQCWPMDDTGDLQWSLELNDYSGNHSRAVIGDHLVLVPGDRLQTYDRSVYESLTIGS